MGCRLVPHILWCWIFLQSTILYCRFPDLEGDCSVFQMYPLFRWDSGKLSYQVAETEAKKLKIHQVSFKKSQHSKIKDTSRILKFTEIRRSLSYLWTRTTPKIQQSHYNHEIFRYSDSIHLRIEQFSFHLVTEMIKRTEISYKTLSDYRLITGFWGGW